MGRGRAIAYVVALVCFVVAAVLADGGARLAFVVAAVATLVRLGLESGSLRR